MFSLLCIQFWTVFFKEVMNVLGMLCATGCELDPCPFCSAQAKKETTGPTVGRDCQYCLPMRCLSSRKLLCGLYLWNRLCQWRCSRIFTWIHPWGNIIKKVVAIQFPMISLFHIHFKIPSILVCIGWWVVTLLRHNWSWHFIGISTVITWSIQLSILFIFAWQVPNVGLGQLPSCPTAIYQTSCSVCIWGCLES